MGIRLGLRLGVSVIDPKYIQILKELSAQGFRTRAGSLKNFMSESTWSIGELTYVDEFLNQMQGSSSEHVKETCEILGIDHYAVYMYLYNDRLKSFSFDIRDYSDEDQVVLSPAVKHCDFLKRKKKLNPLFIQSTINSSSSRYGDLLDSYLMGTEDPYQNKIKFLGAGIWSSSGYVAKKDFSVGRMNYEKGKTYFWGDLVAYFYNKFKDSKPTADKLAKSPVVSEIIGLSDEFHPCVSPDILFIIYHIYLWAGVPDQFNKEEWQFNLYPCILYDWS